MWCGSLLLEDFYLLPLFLLFCYSTYDIYMLKLSEVNISLTSLVPKIILYFVMRKKENISYKIISGICPNMKTLKVVEIAQSTGTHILHILGSELNLTARFRQLGVI